LQDASIIGTSFQGPFIRGEVGREMRYWFVSGMEGEIAKEGMDPSGEFPAAENALPDGAELSSATGKGPAHPTLARGHVVTEKR
jgi:hypothetical protein